MTQTWKGEEVVSVTRVQVGPCTVVQIKNDKKDGYNAIQIGFDEKKEKNIRKPQKGHLKNTKTNIRFLREFRDKNENIKPGDVIDVSTFESGDKIQVTGISKGKGFQGVVKRHGFHGQNTSHGTKDQVRMPGSAGATGPAHVFKGQGMPGRMGGDRVTTKNLEIIEVDLENNILLIKGAVPGARNGLILISGEGELKTITNDKLPITNKKKETGKDEVKVDHSTSSGQEKKEEGKTEEKLEQKDTKTEKNKEDEKEEKK